VFDEAHNIMETITSMNSVSVTQTQLAQGSVLLGQYIEKYGSRLAPKNLTSLKAIHSIVDRLSNHLSRPVESPAKQEVSEVMDLLLDTEIYKQELSKLSEFFDKSDLVRKINGFIESHMDKKAPGSRSVLFAVKEFIRVLAHRPDDGKIVIDTSGEGKTLQYLCLNPTTTLKRILDQVKAVIFISGTLEPSQEFNLLINLAGKVSRFSCDHIIPRQHFQGIVLPSLASKALDFRYQSR